jgi:hypothetical protein
MPDTPNNPAKLPKDGAHEADAPSQALAAASQRPLAAEHDAPGQSGSGLAQPGPEARSKLAPLLSSLAELAGSYRDVLHLHEQLVKALGALPRAATGAREPARLSRETIPNDDDAVKSPNSRGSHSELIRRDGQIARPSSSQDGLDPAAEQKPAASRGPQTTDTKDGQRLESSETDRAQERLASLGAALGSYRALFQQSLGTLADAGQELGSSAREVLRLAEAMRRLAAAQTGLKAKVDELEQQIRALNNP